MVDKIPQGKVEVHSASPDRDHALEQHSDFSSHPPQFPVLDPPSCLLQVSQLLLYIPLVSTGNFFPSIIEEEDYKMS